MKRWKAVLIVTAAMISICVSAYRIVGYVLYRNIVSNRSTAANYREDELDGDRSDGDKSRRDRTERDEYDSRKRGNGEGASPIEEAEESAEEMFRRIEQEMRAVTDYLYTEGALADTDEANRTFAMEVDAKGWPYAVVYREEMDFNGIKGYKVQTITYDYTRAYERQDEFVYEEEYYDENGNSVKDTQILDFFLVDRETLEVTDEHTTEWGIHAE